VIYSRSKRLKNRSYHQLHTKNTITLFQSKSIYRHSNKDDIKMRITVKQLKQLIREAVEEVIEEKEELKGDQDELDVNYDGELTGDDFEILGARSKAKAKR
jgi:transcriptional regulator